MRRAACSLLAAGALGVLAVLLGPVGAAHAATVPFDLYAVTGSTTLPAGGESVSVWGYNTSNAPVSRPGGPTLIVNEGDTVQITLHNQLGEGTALLFQGQEMVPDTTGAAPAGTKLYTFTAGSAGTYLYEAGLLPNAQHQVAMGLYGALIVRPAAAGQAYDDAATAFDDEAVLVLSEIDPALNNAANPASFDMRKYAPRYFLVNGEVHPNTDTISTTGGNDVLLRYVNAGTQYHSMAVLGAHQRVIALDGSPLGFSRRYVAETFGPGQTADAIVAAPDSTDDLRLPIYDGSLLLHNSNTAGSGGMLTTIDATGTGPGPDGTGPATRDVAHSAGDLTATIDETTTGGADVAAAEYFVDTVGAPGTGASMTATAAPFDSVSEDVTAALSVPSGEHVLYVRGQDSAGNWGSLSSVLLSGADAGGPTTKSPTLTPRLTNGTGTAGVAVSATGDDADSGGSNIAAAEYFIDTVGPDGSGATMAVNQAAPVASLDATIPAGTVVGLSEGTHVVWIHAQDAQGNWGEPITVNLVVDKTGPSTSGVSVDPTPNNGTGPFNASTPAVRVAATTLSDPISGTVNSLISAGEVFIDTAGANGSGIPLRASDGVFNDASEGGYADIPLATVAALSNGSHTLHVHAKDAAGNWGPMGTTILVVDKVRPTVSSVAAAPNPTQGATSVTLSATATDAATGVTRAEWFRGADPGVGNGTAMTLAGSGPYSLNASINVSNLSEGAYPILVRARDGAGNWSLTSSTVLNVRGPLSLSTFGNSNPPGVAGTADDADIYGWSGSAYTRSIDVSAAPYNLPIGANVDGFDRVDATHFYMSFSADNTTVPGLGAVQDEDVVFYNAGTWSVYFNGTANALTVANQDLDAISIVGGILYFSTLGNTNPPGVGGVADDADIYRWNGTSFARVWDATANGLAAATNVDGYVRVDATHFYLSFGTLTTTVAVLGTVQDEDVVYNNSGTWSVYFNGTGHGLTTDNLDVDAFDVP
ncbi:multicopper oxidase family protein [Nocardioides sp.]|uniref:multicopper oxidase family protein n=1 Tax=Nocardioides sp. TaxID=35761 RepID=UPI0031FF2555